MNTIKSITREYLDKLSPNLLASENSFTLEHGSGKKEEILRKIRENVDKKKGVYIYTNPISGEVLYVGKAVSLYGRIKCHYDESVFPENGEKKGIAGDAKKGMYPAFFRDTHKGQIKITWIEIEEESFRKVVEEALHYMLKPKFINFQKQFNQSHNVAKSADAKKRRG